MFKKLLDIQKEIGAISKDSTNPFFKSKYFDINALLEVVKPVLSKYGIVLLQPLTHINGKPAIKTMLIEAETGVIIEDITPITENSDPQKMGSAVTYFRRYSLQSLLSLQAEDDDANKASGKKDNTTDEEKEKLKVEKTLGKAYKSISEQFSKLGYTRSQIESFLLGYEYNSLTDCKNPDTLREMYKTLESLEKKR